MNACPVLKKIYEGYAFTELLCTQLDITLKKPKKSSDKNCSGDF